MPIESTYPTGSFVSARGPLKQTGHSAGWMLGLIGLAYLFLIYFKPLFVRVPVTANVIGYANMVVLGWGALALLHRRILTGGFRERSLLFACLVVGVVSLSSLISQSEGTAIWDGLYSILGTWLAFELCVEIGGSERPATALLVAFSVLACANAGVGIWGAMTGRTVLDVAPESVGQGMFGFDPRSGRSGGIAGENYVGIYNLPAVLFGLQLILSRRARILGGVLLVAGGLGIAVSLSRTSFICGALGIVAFLFLRRTRLRPGTMVLLLLVFGLLPVAASRVLSRQTSELNDAAHEALEGRWSVDGVVHDSRFGQWGAYSNIFGSDLVWGKGPGYIAERVARGDLVPHNSLLDVLVEYGLLGAILFTNPFVRMWRVTKAMRRRAIRDGVAPVALACFWGMAFGFVTLSNPTARVIWMMAGLAIGASRRALTKAQQ